MQPAPDEVSRDQLSLEFQACPAAVRDALRRMLSRPPLSTLSDEGRGTAELVLAEVLNASHGTVVDVAVDRARAADLVATNRLFQQSAELAGDAPIDDVLEELERVLVEIANAPADLSSADLDALRARIERGGLIFRVRVLSDELRARQESGPLDQTKGRTS